MRKIVMAYPLVTRKMRKAVQKVLKSRWIGQAEKVDEFEKLLESKFGGHSVAVNSGTSALELAYDLIGLKKGDEVITTPLTCTATNIPLIRRGCKLVFVDVNPSTLCIDDRSIRERLTKRTKAVVIVNLGGIKADIGKMPVPVVADSCQALGVNNGDYVAYSFQAIKHITTGDGGALICKDKKEAEKAKLRRWFGIDRTKKISNNWQPYKNRAILFDIEYPGYKYHMNDIAASMGIEALKDWDKILEHRKKIFEIYQDTGIQMIDGKVNTYWLAGVLVEDRDSFCQYLNERGIETNVMHVRNDVYKIFKPYRTKLPNMDWVDERYIYIPCHNKMSLRDARYVAKTIENWLWRFRGTSQPLFGAYKGLKDYWCSRSRG
jgi:dTDP-4-amino-4,6-dideoxygalactose transaminase